MNRYRNSVSEHPSPALRAPSPLVRRGERDGVRGAHSDSWPVSRSARNKELSMYVVRTDSTPSLIYLGRAGRE